MKVAGKEGMMAYDPGIGENHPAPKCVLVESGILHRLEDSGPFGDRLEDWMDGLCDQLYADRRGWGVNGEKITRRLPEAK